jgi:hypothetical protein
LDGPRYCNQNPQSLLTFIPFLKDNFVEQSPFVANTEAQPFPNTHCRHHTWLSERNPESGLWKKKGFRG